MACGLNKCFTMVNEKRSDLFTYLVLYCLMLAEDLCCKTQTFLCLLYATKLKVLSILQTRPIDGYLID